MSCGIAWISLNEDRIIPRLGDPNFTDFGNARQTGHDIMRLYVKEVVASPGRYYAQDFKDLSIKIAP